MEFRVSKEFQARLVTADLQATTGLQGTHMTLMFMAMDMDMALPTLIHLLYLHRLV